MGLSVALSVIFLAVDAVRPAWTLFVAVLFYAFSAGPGIVGVLFSRRRTGVGPFLVNVLLAHLYLFYSWLIYPVVYRALLRQLLRRKSWAKTRRLAIS